MQQELSWAARWSLRLGGRYDHLRYRSEDRVEPALDAGKTFARFTPKGSLAYTLDHHTIYGSLGGGVEAPAFNEIDPPSELAGSTSFNPFLEAMHSTTYELGAKGEMVGESGTLTYDAALYWIEVRNELVPYGGGAYFFTAGRSRRRGLELGLDWGWVGHFGARGALTLSDNEYTSYRNDLGTFDGHQVPGLPRVTFSASARAAGPLGLEAEIASENVGHHFADDANTARADGYSLVGASLAWEGGPAGLTLRAFLSGDNLTDQEHVASVFINGVGGELYEPGLPRSWSAGLTLRFR